MLILRRMQQSVRIVQVAAITKAITMQAVKVIAAATEKYCINSTYIRQVMGSISRIQIKKDRHGSNN